MNSVKRPRHSLADPVPHPQRLLFMPVRIVHTADNHIGIPYRPYSRALQEKLLNERFAALERIVAEASAREADFIVVSGDLFDSIRVADRTIRQTLDLFRGFTGEAVLLLPGNHDYCSGPDSELWKKIRREGEGNSKLLLLTQPETQTFELQDQLVQFFPCPCPSMKGSEPVTGWVADAEKDANAVRIGIAHGNVTGLGLDAEGCYFNMTPESLTRAGLTTWLLGHIHVPFPAADRGDHSPYFMAGIHTPDSVRVRHGGSAWYIECTPREVTRFEQLKPGQIRFTRLQRELNSDLDIDRLIQECRDLPSQSTLLDLQLSGRLTDEQEQGLRAKLETSLTGFLELTHDLSEIHKRVDAAAIAAAWPRGTLAERLLTTLLADTEHPDDATVAYDLLQELQHS
jgi:DNA repair exonuclease SbcCD nuclease subunit